MRVVTIDGPAGAGKSAVARRVAQQLGWRILDTGAMYRAVTLAALRRSTDLASDEALAELVSGLEVHLPPDRVLLDGEDVTVQIRDLEVTRSTSQVADSRSVRARLVEWQRVFASQYDTVTEGRDQGTIVFPDAFLKFFLTASVEERAKRRHRELVARGDVVAIETVEADIRARDVRDESRAIAPLRPAADAIRVDTTGQSFESVVEQVFSTVHEYLERTPEVTRHGD
jgi:cytidylate kinase